MTKIAKVRNKLKETLIVGLPESELNELKDFCKNYGSKQYILDETGIAFATLDRVLESGKGQVRVLSSIKQFMGKINSEKKKQNIA